MPRSQSRRRARESRDDRVRARLDARHVDATGPPTIDAVVAPRGAPGARRRRSRPASWSGVQPVLTQVPPKSLRSMSATRHAGGGQPAGERRPGLAGADDDGVEPVHREHHCDDQQRAADGDGVLDQRGRRVLAERRGEPARAARAAERADHRADDAGDEPGHEHPAAGADARRRRVRRTRAGRPNCTGTLRLGVDGSWSVTSSPSASTIRIQGVTARRETRGRYPRAAGARMRRQAHGGGSGHGPQAGDDADQEREHDRRRADSMGHLANGTAQGRRRSPFWRRSSVVRATTVTPARRPPGASAR